MAIDKVKEYFSKHGIADRVSILALPHGLMFVKTGRFEMISPP